VEAVSGAAPEALEERRGRAWRGWVARLLTVLGVLFLVVSIAANFVERQALDTGNVEETARQLVDDREIRELVAANMTDQLFASVDVQAALEARLPEEQRGFAGALTGALRPVAERLALEILERPRLQELWVRAVGVAQGQIVRVLDDDARFLETDEGVVVLDLRPLLVELTNQLPVVPDLSERLPANAGIVTLFEAEQLETAQQATRLLRFVADWIWVLALAAWAGALYLARDRRIELRAVAAGFVVVGLLVLVARRLVGRYLVDELSATTSEESAVRNTWEILTRLLAESAWAAIALGAIALVGVWLVGPGARAATARGWLAPHLAKAQTAYGVAGALFLLLILWGPISYIERPLTILVLAVLAAVGVELLRRFVLREAAATPDTGPDAPPAVAGGG